MCFDYFGIMNLFDRFVLPNPVDGVDICTLLMLNLAVCSILFSYSLVLYSVYFFTIIPIGQFSGLYIIFFCSCGIKNLYELNFLSLIDDSIKVNPECDKFSLSSRSETFSFCSLQSIRPMYTPNLFLTVLISKLLFFPCTMCFFLFICRVS
jgi:hypothetical protein